MGKASEEGQGPSGAVEPMMMMMMHEFEISHFGRNMKVDFVEKYMSVLEYCVRFIVQSTKC